jgi:hypothetical protein
LRAYSIHAVRGRGNENLLVSAGHDADAHEEIDDLVRSDAEEDVVRGGQAAQFRYAAFYLRMGWIWVAVEIKAEDRVEHWHRLHGGSIPVELQRRHRRSGGRRNVVGRGDAVAVSVLVRVQKDATGVVVPRTPIRVQSEDVRPNDALDVKVRWPRWRRGGCQTEDGHSTVWFWL